MFFVIIFMAVASLVSYAFPDWSWATVLVVSLGVVATLRIVITFSGRKISVSEKSE